MKTPININDLECSYEEKKSVTSHNKNKIRFKKLGLNKKAKFNNLASITVLKEPISLDDIQWDNAVQGQDSSVTFNVKTVQSAYYYGPPRKKNISLLHEVWKQNAIAIFENSFVYPFIYASNKYKCFICSQTFLDASFLKDHTINGHSIGDIKQELNNRIRDKSVKVDVSCLKCKICLVTLPDLNSLKVHLKNHGKNIDPEFNDNIIPFKLEGKVFNCQICGEKFLKLRLLIIHMSKHFNNFSCDVCGSVFISLNLLKRHLQIHQQGTFPCDKCDKVFSNSAKRTLHMRGVHIKQFPRRCPICPERFNSNYQRTKHLRIIHNQTSGLFRCETCGREYDLKYHLLLHIRSVHLQERNQECNICHARFFSKYCLSRHMVIHTGEKNFVCGVCGKAYARMKNLKEHTRTHVPGVACEVCGLSCSDIAALSVHVNNCHGVI